MKGGWVQAEDLYVIIMFLENIVINTLESPWNLAENPLENPGIKFHFTVGHPEDFSSGNNCSISIVYRQLDHGTIINKNFSNPSLPTIIAT